MSQPAFVRPLFECDDSSSLHLRNGHRFIRKLPDDRSLGYLHKLYPPLDAYGVQRMNGAIGRRLPEEFESFLMWSNGASLFDNQVYIFGFVESLTRGIEVEKQQPISIVDANRDFPADRRDDGWTRIGSVVGWDSRYEIDLHEKEECVLTSASGTLSKMSFEHGIAAIIGRVSGCFSCNGIIDRSYAELEAALLSLVRQTH